jgi:hypothetical protein
MMVYPFPLGDWFLVVIRNPGSKERMDAFPKSMLRTHKGMLYLLVDIPGFRISCSEMYLSSRVFLQIVSS